VKQRANILYVVNEAYYFLSHYSALARAAMAAGYQVHIAAPNDHVWAPEGFSSEELDAAGFKLHAFPLSRRGQNPISEIRSAVALLRLYKKLQPNLVHHLTIKPVIYGGIAARIMKVPAMVCSVTGLGQVFVSSGARAWLRRALVKYGYRIALHHKNARLVVQNPEDGQVLVDAGAVRPSQVVSVRGSGVSLEEFVPVPEPNETPVVILPGRLIWEKGIREFVEAARLLRSQGVDARFALVGGTNVSNPRAVPRAQLGEWEKDGLVEWWGRREDMPLVFASCHIVCLPSSYGEGVPRVLIEAAASGRSIVATQLPGCRAVVKDGENGLLVPVNDPIALAAALRLVIEDPDMRLRFGSVGRKVAESQFCEKVLAERIVKTYDALLRDPESEE